MAVSTDTLIKPGELIRLVSDGSTWAFGRSAFFEISFGGQVTFTDSASINVEGNAWLDMAAPLQEGVHVVRCRYPDTFFGSHWVATAFTVDEDAAPVPDKPRSGFLGDVKGILLLVAVVAVAAVVVPRIIPKQ